MSAPLSAPLPVPLSAPESAQAFAPGLFIRGFHPPLPLSQYRLVAFDMDSTLINIECVDEIAALAGRGTDKGNYFRGSLFFILKIEKQLI